MANDKSDCTRGSTRRPSPGLAVHTMASQPVRRLASFRLGDGTASQHSDEPAPRWKMGQTEHATRDDDPTFATIASLASSLSLRDSSGRVQPTTSTKNQSLEHTVHALTAQLRDERRKAFQGVACLKERDAELGRLRVEFSVVQRKLASAGARERVMLHAALHLSNTPLTPVVLRHWRIS